MHTYRFPFSTCRYQRDMVSLDIYKEQQSPVQVTEAHVHTTNKRINVKSLEKNVYLAKGNKSESVK